MKQSSTDQLGEAGQTAVQLFFNDLGWGPLPTGKHDLGTDLFVQLRGSDLIDLGMLLGVQVKTGDSHFEEPTQVGGRSGWWFRESDSRHLGYWANHHIPHILVMQDESRERQLWARLDSSTIESTGKGIRVFVPDDQVLSPDAASVWTDLVAEARKLQSFEGSRWTFNITQVPESEWARYATLASRIVAPHPNQGFSADINWAEAVALCLQADIQRWDEFAVQREDVPTPEEARALDSAGWKFAAATYSWLTGTTDELESLETSGMSHSLRVAHAVCVSTILTDRGDWTGAIDLLRSLRDPAELSVDQAWLAVQLGWALFDSGQIDSARAEFQSSLELHAAFPSSLVNSAIRSAGILALFELAPMLSGDVAAAVQASDSMLSWWQTQQIEAASTEFLSRSYHKWANDTTITFGASDITHNELVSARLTALLVGNRRSSRYASYLRAMANLALPNGDHAKPEVQLEVLRAAGYPKELVLAVRRFRSQGPLSPVRDYMADVTLERATPTSIRADLESLEVAGAYVPSGIAEAWIEFLLETFDNPALFMKRFKLDFNPLANILKSLGGLQLHFTEADERRVLSTVLGLPSDTTQLLESPVRRVLNAFPTELVEAKSAQISARGRTLPADSWLSRALVDLVSTWDADARESVHGRILKGSLAAIPEHFSIDALTSDEAEAIVASCDRQIKGYQGQFNECGFGGPDAYQFAAAVAVYGPEEVRSAAWRVIVDGIVDANVIQERKVDAIKFLATHAESIPEMNRQVLLDTSKTFRILPPSHLTGFSMLGLVPAGPAFTQLYLELEAEGSEWEGVLSELLAAGPVERSAAINVVSRRAGHELLLLALTRDSDNDVAHTAMHALARRAAEDSSIAESVLSQLLKLVTAGGEQAALSIGRGIVAARRRGPGIEPLIGALRSHESLRIRRLAYQLEVSVEAEPNQN